MSKPKIRFEGFADDWEQRKLGDVADIVGGGTPSTNKADYWDGDIDWYTPAEIGDVIYIESSKRKITEDGLNNSSAKMLPIGSVLFTSRAGIGKMAILRKKACTNQGFQSIIPHSNELDSYFIFSRSEELKRYGEVVGAGSTFVEVSGKQMSLMDLMIPTMIDEQIKIGDYFRKLDDLITLHQWKYYFCEKNRINAWEQRKLIDEVASIDTGKSKFVPCDSGEYEILGSTSVIGYDNSYDYEGDFLLTARVGANAGELYRHSGKVKISDNTVFIQGNYLDFIYYALLNFDIKKLSFGTGQPLVKASELKGQNIRMPVSMKERKYIGNYFKALDNLITLHQRKCDEIKKLKKYMLQNMFPQEGEKTPKIRFDEFTDDWEQRKLDMITDVRDGTHDSPKYVEEGHPFITSKNIKEGYINYEDVQHVSNKDFEEINKRSKVDINDILMGMIGTVGNIAIVREKTNFAIKNVALIKDTGGVFYLYLYHCLQSNSVVYQLSGNLDGGTQKFIALNKIRNLSIPLPNKDEQYKIGNHMECLDRLITLHQRKCDELKEMKKFMLQNMFV